MSRNERALFGLVALALAGCGGSGTTSFNNDAPTDKCAGVVCTASDSCHVAGTCDPNSGHCSNPVAPDGTTCDDANACTTGETCHSGRCQGGSAVTCTALDQCHTAGTCDPATGCSNPPVADGTSCDDANACTTGDACEAGSCTGTAVSCTASDQCHVAGTCDPSTGVCSNPAAPDGTSCDDGDLCTTGDSCTSGACAGTAVGCTASDQCHEAGTCDPATGACSNPPLTGTPCDDGDLCTTGDLCVAGSCLGLLPVVCTASDACHVPGVCDSATGLCSNPDAPDGTACDDGDLCTRSDSCSAGACVGSDEVTCTASDQCHTAGTCDPATGVCSNPAAPDGTTCDDGDACTTLDACSSGACVGADPVTCEPSDQCHAAGTCDPATGTCSNPSLSSDPPAVTRDLGFWSVHETALASCLDGGSVDTGLATIATVDDALGLLWASPFELADGSLRAEHDRDLLLLARELFVATCNVRLFSATPPAELFSNAHAALAGDDCALLTSLAGSLAAFDDSGEDAPLPGTFDPGLATPDDAAARAVDATTATGRACAP